MKGSLRASGFGPPRLETSIFPKEFAGVSVPVRFAQKPCFSKGFAHVWPVPLTVCCGQATRCMVPAAL